MPSVLRMPGIAVIALCVVGGSVAAWILKGGAEVEAPSEMSGALEAPLVPHPGDTAQDREIQQLQKTVESGRDPAGNLERLGWAYITKARISGDPGYYKLAEQCALRMEMTSAEPLPSALLLRGHALENMHQFKVAEDLARRALAREESVAGFGLLGDALMEQGKLDESIVSYQAMLNLKPNLQSYSRAAHLRWLTGDLEGAIEMMRLAVSAGSPREPETVAWAYTRLAAYEFQAGRPEIATRSIKIAFEFLKDYPAALLLQGRLLLASDQISEAVDTLWRAADLNPLPEYQWALADALRTAGRNEDAATVEEAIIRGGAASDPRTFSLYLATRGEQPEEALALARAELQMRSDIHSHDALAWALLAAGRTGEAQAEMDKALSANTGDARLFLHAGVIAAADGRPEVAAKWFSKTDLLRGMLLPSEREILSKFSGARGISLASEQSIPTTHRK